LEGVLDLPALDFSMRVADVYRDVFPPA